MSTGPKFRLEIDCSDCECDRYGNKWANYGTIVTEGDNLEELITAASIDITDQDGGELDMVPADSDWMQKRIESAYLDKLLQAGM